jgi:hypothetical protein
MLPLVQLGSRFSITTKVIDFTITQNLIISLKIYHGCFVECAEGYLG